MLTYNSLVIAVLSTKSVLTRQTFERRPPNKISHCTHISRRGNVHPIKIEHLDCFRDVISLLARVFIFLIDRATQEVPMNIFERNCQFMHNFVNGGLPSPLLLIYQYHRDIHDHNTRHSTDPRTPSANSDNLRKTVQYQGPKLWASLDGRLNGSRTKSLFKTRLKINCIDNY